MKIYRLRTLKNRKEASTHCHSTPPPLKATKKPKPVKPNEYLVWCVCLPIRNEFRCSSFWWALKEEKKASCMKIKANCISENISFRFEMVILLRCVRFSLFRSISRMIVWNDSESLYQNIRFLSIFFQLDLPTLFFFSLSSLNLDKWMKHFVDVREDF